MKPLVWHHLRLPDNILVRDHFFVQNQADLEKHNTLNLQFYPPKPTALGATPSDEVAKDNSQLGKTSEHKNESDKSAAFYGLEHVSPHKQEKLRKFDHPLENSVPQI